jgi:hypothetical protein
LSNKLNNKGNSNMRQLLTLVITFSLVISSVSSAQWSSDPYENTIVAYSVHAHQMISDGDGGAIIIYWSSAYYGLRAQRLDKYGHICWGDSGVSVGDVGYYHDEDFSLCIRQWCQVTAPDTLYVGTEHVSVRIFEPQNYTENTDGTEDRSS